MRSVSNSQSKRPESQARPLSSGAVLIAGAVDLDEVLVQLAATRPVFHSEADSQLAFAWLVQQYDAKMRVRLETRPAPGVHLDLDFARPDLDRATAIELKYLTRLWTGTVGGERFELKNQGAQDIRAYDIVKDIVRVEKFVASQPGCDGAVITLTNDASYWKPGAGLKTTNAAAFRLGHGTILSGVRDWGPNTGAGTRKGGSYPSHSQAPTPSAGATTHSSPAPRQDAKSVHSSLRSQQLNSQDN